MIGGGNGTQWKQCGMIRLSDMQGCFEVYDLMAGRQMMLAAGMA